MGYEPHRGGNSVSAQIAGPAPVPVMINYAGHVGFVFVTNKYAIPMSRCSKADKFGISTLPSAKFRFEACLHDGLRFCDGFSSGEQVRGAQERSRSGGRDRERCSFSNTDGGIILIGVSNDGEIVGRELTQGLEDDLHEMIGNVRDPGRYSISSLLIDGTAITVLAVASARNASVIRVLRAFHLAEDSGEGVDVMQDTMRDELLDPPIFADTGGAVRVTLPVRSAVAPSERA